MTVAATTPALVGPGRGETIVPDSTHEQPLREYLANLITGIEGSFHREILTALAVMKERWDGHRREHDMHERNHDLRHGSDQVALQLDKTEIDRRLHEHNAFRQQIEGERRDYITRDILDARFSNIEEKLDGKFKAMTATLEALTSIVGDMRNREANLQGRFWSLGIAIGLTIVAVNVIIALVTRRG